MELGIAPMELGNAMMLSGSAKMAAIVWVPRSIIAVSESFVWS